MYGYFRIDIVWNHSDQMKCHFDYPFSIQRGKRSKDFVGTISRLVFSFKRMRAGDRQLTLRFREACPAYESTEQRCIQYSDAGRMQTKSPRDAGLQVMEGCKHKMLGLRGRHRVPHACPLRKGARPTWAPRSPSIDRPIEDLCERHPWRRGCNQDIPW